MAYEVTEGQEIDNTNTGAPYGIKEMLNEWWFSLTPTEGNEITLQLRLENNG
jgi:hypothetical protein